MNRHHPDKSTASGGRRLFVAAPLPSGVVAQAAVLLARLAESGAPVRWTDPRRLHLTLAFLGDAVPADQVPAITAAIDRACRGLAPLVVACGGLGRFPATGRPRVIWLGLTHGEAALVRLQEAVAGALDPLGFPREAPAWQPHITLGRIPDHGRSAAGPWLAAALVDEAGHDVGRGIIDAVVLYASERTPTGSAYRVVHATPLGSR